MELKIPDTFSQLPDMTCSSADKMHYNQKNHPHLRFLFKIEGKTHKTSKITLKIAFKRQVDDFFISQPTP